MEEGVNDRNGNKNEEYDEGKEADETTDYDRTTIGEGKGVIIERGGKDFDLDEIEEFSSSGDSFIILLIKRNK